MNNLFLYEPFYDLERFFEQTNGPRRESKGNTHRQQNLVDGAVRSFRPRMDLHEDSEKNLVTATFEFPGISKEDIQINLHNGKLTVSAETKHSNDLNENGYAVRERHFGKLSRTLQLPQGIKDSEIKASVENGLLTVTFPKSGQEAKPKRITVS